MLVCGLDRIAGKQGISVFPAAVVHAFQKTVFHAEEIAQHLGLINIPAGGVFVHFLERYQVGIGHRNDIRNGIHADHTAAVASH